MSDTTAVEHGLSASFFRSQFNGNKLAAFQAAETLAEMRLGNEHQFALQLMIEIPGLDLATASSLAKDSDLQRTCQAVYAEESRTHAPLPRAPQRGGPCRGTGSIIPDEVDTVTTEDCLGCPIPLCKRKGPPFKKRRGLREHFCMKHNMSPAEARIEADKAFSRSSEQTRSSESKNTPIDSDDSTIQQVQNIVGHVPDPEQFMINAAGVGGQFANLPSLPSEDVHFEPSLNMATHWQQRYGADNIPAQQAYADGQTPVDYRESLYANTRSYLYTQQSMAPLQRISEHIGGPSYTPEWSNTNNVAIASHAQSPSFKHDNLDNALESWEFEEYLEGRLWNHPGENDDDSRKMN